jgi:GGDEF domain-containing protein
LEIDKHERDEMLARWQRDQRTGERDASIERAVAQLIDEACKGVAHGRVAADRCALAGDSLARAWRERDLELASLVDEIASVRRSVWDTVVARFRAGTAGPDTLVEARAAIDAAFDAAMRRAVVIFQRESPKAEPAAEPRGGRDPDIEIAVSDFHAGLAAALAHAAAHASNLALVVVHFDARTDGTDTRTSDGHLLDLSEILGLQLRHQDQSFALSDSDFALLCPDTGAEGARHLLERIAYAVRVYARRSGVSTTLTGGFAVAPEDGTTPLDLIRIALADREFSLLE